MGKETSEVCESQAPRAAQAQPTTEIRHRPNPVRQAPIPEQDGEEFFFEEEPEDDDWEEPEELTPAELDRLRETHSRDRSHTPQVDARTHANEQESDVRKQLEDVGIRTIGYSLLKPGNVWFYGFEVPVGLSFTSLRSTLLTEFKSRSSMTRHSFKLHSIPRQLSGLVSQMIKPGQEVF